MAIADFDISPGQPCRHRERILEQRDNNIHKEPSAVMDYTTKLQHGSSPGGMKYVFSLPEKQQPGEKPPVLVFLHGYEEGPPTDIVPGVTRHGPLRSDSPAVVRSFIVIAPQLPVRGDLWKGSAHETMAIVEDVLSLTNGDPGRVYLTGFSYGGNGVFDLALHDPSRWGALWPVDPTRVPVRDPGLPLWLSSGEVSRNYRAAFIQRLQFRHAAGGVTDRVYDDAGLDHVGTARAAFANAGIYEWLLTKRRYLGGRS